nr:PREDICTED: uncharacterized protein LOC109435845 [Rhinolophus sinicus]
MGVTRPGFPSSAQMGDAQCQPLGGRTPRARAAGQCPRSGPAARSPSPSHYLRAAVPGPGGLVLLLLRPARLRRRGGGGSGSGDSPGGGGGARSSLPLSSPGRLRGPYLGPPRLGPWAARGWGMAAHSSSVPASRTQTGTPQPLSLGKSGWLAIRPFFTLGNRSLGRGGAPDRFADSGHFIFIQCHLPLAHQITLHPMVYILRAPCSSLTLLILMTLVIHYCNPRA